MFQIKQRNYWSRGPLSSGSIIAYEYETGKNTYQGIKSQNFYRASNLCHNLRGAIRQRVQSPETQANQVPVELFVEGDSSHSSSRSLLQSREIFHAKFELHGCLALAALQIGNTLSKSRHASDTRCSLAGYTYLNTEFLLTDKISGTKTEATL